MEGCVEHQLIGTDNRINREISLLFTLVFNSAARLRLSNAEAAWLVYRQADCGSQSDIYEGGTQASIEYGTCALNSDRAGSNDLRGVYEGLTQGRSHPPAFP